MAKITRIANFDRWKEESFNFKDADFKTVYDFLLRRHVCFCCTANFLACNGTECEKGIYDWLISEVKQEDQNGKT